VAFALVLVFIVIPILELAVIIEVSGRLGLANTIALLLVVSVAGAWLVRHQGLATIRRIRASLDRGVLPGPDLVDGASIIVAGALLLTPGFLTDAVGLVLLLPPTRALVRGVLRRFLLGRITIREVRYRAATQADGPPRHPFPPDELPPPSRR
jgi:UPF0716 protein FxsA